GTHGRCPHPPAASGVVAGRPPAAGRDRARRGVSLPAPLKPGHALEPVSLSLFLRSLAAIALTVVVAVALALYVSVAAATWWLGVVFVAYAVVQTLYMVRLHHWSSLPRNRALPAGIGPWRPIVARLARFVRQETDTRNELGSELERIHSAVDRLPDGLVVLDRYDHVLWANDAAESLHGIFGTRRPIHHFIRQPEFARFLQANESGSTMRVQLPSQPGRTHELRLHRAQ